MLLRLLRDLFTRGPRALVEPRHPGNEGPSPSTAPDVREILALGRNAQDAGRWHEAEVHYRRALAVEPGDVEANLELARLLRRQGRKLDALPFAFLSVRGAPHDPRLRGFLAEALVGITLNYASDEDRATLTSLCDDPRVSTLWLFPAISGLLKAHPGFAVLAERQGAADVLDPPSPQLSLWMHDRLLLTALPRTIMGDPSLELALTGLRRSMLRRLDPANRSLDASGIPLEFVCALARNCFLTNYAFFASDDESAAVRSLRTRIEASLEEATEEELAVLAMYIPLHRLRDVDALRKRAWSPGLGKLMEEQIEDRMREAALASRHPPVTPIDDPVSLAVNAQYEDNPYPRWNSVSDADEATFEQLYAHLHGHPTERAAPDPLRILIAGCGSGRHPIQVARQFPRAEILAVDLSLASLGYAARMSEKLGVANVSFRQADVLKLGTLGVRFDIIESVGVLHHLREPMAGWRVLRDLLAPHGLMKIALYSRRAREPINAAREFASRLAPTASADEMRKVRRAIIDLPRSDPIRDVLRTYDFYSLNEFRDLVLHVQERQYSLQEIAECLGQLDLRLLALEPDDAAGAAFALMHPGRDARTDLEAWDEVERAHPRSFINMYTFWCCAN